ncbi:MAG: UDP-N-acetylglucosamine 2-epimerase (non-hydrolyzing) [Bacteroidetes bacterium]|nr:UDP-N-acetylglucosamine 2-epimerase (non-hydrolyzing) [Bacteroidota bacterium]
MIKKKKILSIVGARPNFMKVAPLHRAIIKSGLFEHSILHTNQHYDDLMSKIFFKEFGLPKPKINLHSGSSSHAVQTATIMVEFEKVLPKLKPDLIVVVGDVNSTVACSLVAKKLGISVAHIESGLRSFDRTMPEEINRIVTDSISDYLFVSEESGMINLKKEGISKEKTFFVGNIMIDTLVSLQKEIDKSEIKEKYKLNGSDFILVTMHRPSNVDNKNKLGEIIKLLNEFTNYGKVFFPIHPRTRKMLENYNLFKKLSSNKKIIITNPLGYIDFISLTKNCKVVVTDSGGIQEESTFLKVPCITMRENTERPITIKVGSNILAGTNSKNIIDHVEKIFKNNIKSSKIPKYWDGNTATRIVHHLNEKLN